MYLTIIDSIELDREQRSVRKDGQEIHLTGLEYDLFSHPQARAMPAYRPTALFRFYVLSLI